jgi:hypothetical protein
MSTMLSLAELRRRGLEILIRELGYVDAMRFLHQYDSGQGDYTCDRQQILPTWTVDEMVKEADKLAPGR